MSIPPWIVALIVLIVASGVGAYIVGFDYGLPEGFAPNEGFATDPSQEYREDTHSRRLIVPPLKYPDDDKYIMQSYGLHDRGINKTNIRGGGDPIFNFNPAGNDGFVDRAQQGKQGEHASERFIGDGVTETKKLYPGLDQNISVTQQPVAYSGIAADQEDSPVKQQLAVVQTVAKGTIPTDDNLALISGGSGEAANTPLTQGYQPHQEKIYPDQHPRPQHAQVTAGAPTDAGTAAEEIMTTSVRMPSVREMVREEERRESESFSNPYAVRYQAV